MGEINLEYSKDWNQNLYVIPLPMVAPVMVTVKYD